MASSFADGLSKAQRAFVIAWANIGNPPPEDYPESDAEVRMADWARSWGFFEPTSYKITNFGRRVAQNAQAHDPSTVHSNESTDT